MKTECYLPLTRRHLVQQLHRSMMEPSKQSVSFLQSSIAHGLHPRIPPLEITASHVRKEPTRIRIRPHTRAQLIFWSIKKVWSSVRQCHLMNESLYSRFSVESGVWRMQREIFQLTMVRRLQTNTNTPSLSTDPLFCFAFVARNRKQNINRGNESKRKRVGLIFFCPLRSRSHSLARRKINRKKKKKLATPGRKPDYRHFFLSRVRSIAVEFFDDSCPFSPFPSRFPT